MKRVAVIIREPDRQYEGLRTSLGMLLEDVNVRMIVLDHPIEKVNEAYRDNLAFLDEMGGEYFSNHDVNVEKHGFKPLEAHELPSVLRECDVVIPF